MTTISLQSRVYVSEHIGMECYVSSRGIEEKLLSRFDSIQVECHHFVPPRFRVSKQRQPVDLASIGAHATLITQFTTIGAALTKNCQPENAQTIADTSHTSLPAQPVIRALARLSQQS
jgi:hypothetical protein